MEIVIVILLLSGGAGFLYYKYMKKTNPEELKKLQQAVKDKLKKEIDEV